METKRLIIAVVLSIAVIFVFGVFIPSYFSKKEPPQEPVKTEKGKQGVSEGVEKTAEELGAQEETKEEEVKEGEKKAAEPEEPESTSSMPQYPLELVTFKTDLVKAVFSTKSASITKLELLDPHFTDENGVKQNMVSHRPATNEVLPQLTFKADSPHTPIPEDLTYRLIKRGKVTLVFASEYGPWRIKRRYKIFDDYRINVSTILKNISEETISVKPILQVRLYKEQKKRSGIFGWLNPSRDIPGGLCNVAGETERKDVNKLHKERIAGAGKINFTAVDDLYFISAMIPLVTQKGKTGNGSSGGEPSLSSEQAVSFGCNVSVNDQNVITAQLFRGESKLSKGESSEIKVTTYIGSKEYNRLSDFGYELNTAINFGWFGGLAIFFLSVLKTLHSWVGNWGIAIILLTLVIKLVLMPLTHWSYVSMRNMAAVKPLIDDINKKFSAPEDREKKNQAMLELYKAHKINPMMGCLPMLLQMPIWIALYSMLARSVELYHTPFFLWITDLSQRDPYYILPIILGASMFLQQRLTPTTADSQQAKMMMYFMPLMFTGFMLFLPSGLNLYILVSTVLTILQQKLLYKPKVATAGDKKVQLMAEIDQKELSNLKKDKARKSKNGKRK